MEMSMETWFISLGVTYFMGLATSKKTKNTIVFIVVCLLILYVLYRVAIKA